MKIGRDIEFRPIFCIVLAFFRPLGVPVYTFGAKKRPSCTILTNLTLKVFLFFCLSPRRERSALLLIRIRHFFSHGTKLAKSNKPKRLWNGRTLLINLSNIYYTAGASPCPTDNLSVCINAFCAVNNVIFSCKTKRGSSA